MQSQNININYRLVVLAGLLVVILVACGSLSAPSDMEPTPIVITSPPIIVTVVTSPTSAIMPTAPFATAVPMASPTPVGIKDPTGVVPAETPIVADGLQLTVFRSLTFDGDEIGISMLVMNFSGEQKILRYSLNSFKLMDDLGNEYPPALHGYDKKHIYRGRQKQIEPGESLELTSNYNSWVSDNWSDVQYLPRFVGPIPLQAQSLIVVIENFGPFPPLQVAIDLQ